MKPDMDHKCSQNLLKNYVEAAGDIENRPPGAKTGCGKTRDFG
jgi:hypothetical protein